MSEAKKDIYLEWATLDQLVQEIIKRGYRFAFVAEHDNLQQEFIYYYPNKPLLIIAMCSKLINDILIRFVKKDVDNQMVDSLTAIMFIFASIFNKGKT